MRSASLVSVSAHQRGVNGACALGRDREHGGTAVGVAELKYIMVIIK